MGVGIDDTATGLTHIGAREYDQTSGRFLSADPVIDIADPLQMNGYAYANNSPVSHSDPTGLWIDDGTGHSEPRRDGGPTGPQNPRGPGVPRGGTGPGGCYYSCKAKPGWVQTHTPVTNNAQRLRDLFCEYGPNGRFPDGTYWQTPIVEESGTNNVCFGREGCRLAYKFLMKSDDVAEAKRIAANYCLQNFKRCQDDAESYERGKRWETLPYAFIPGGRAAKGGALGGCAKCFLAGTDVLMADGTSKDIEDIAVGDLVQATDPDTGETGPRKVTRLIRTEGDKFFNELSIATEDGVEKLIATYEHPFWSPSERDWIEAGDLKPGMTLRTDDGDTVIVTGNRPFTKRARTYNLTVDDLHTYYVLAGSTPVLVHNSSCPTSAADGERLRRQLAGEAGQLPGVRSADDLFDTPSALRGGVTPDQVRPLFANRKGWVEEGLGRGRNAGGGWVIREYTGRGDPTGRMLRWNPGGGHHGEGAYWRVVGPEGDLGGIIR